MTQMETLWRQDFASTGEQEISIAMSVLGTPVEYPLPREVVWSTAISPGSVGRIVDPAHRGVYPILNLCDL